MAEMCTHSQRKQTLLALQISYAGAREQRLLLCHFKGHDLMHAIECEWHDTMSDDTMSHQQRGKAWAKQIPLLCPANLNP